jgi:type II secretory pathway predicted ATPase ExeA/chromosome segregation ATPase
MYADYFGLCGRPFEDRAGPKFTYLSPAFEEALAALEYESRYGQGMTLVIGEAGTGKTQLLRTLMGRLDSTEQSILLSIPPTRDFHLIHETCQSLGITVTSDESARHVVRMRKHVARACDAGRRIILLVDQAENLTADNLRELEEMAELRGVREKGIAVLLAAQPRFRAALRDSSLARLRQQLCGERVLQRLNHRETESYIDHRLQAAGAVSAGLFDGDAVLLIHAASGGVPRLINRLCDEALVAAYGAGVTTVTRELTIDIAQRHAYREHAADLKGLANPALEANALARPAHREHAASATAMTRAAGQPGAAYATGTAYDDSLDAAAADLNGPTDPDAPTPTDEAFQVPSSGPSPFAQAPMILQRLETSLARAERFAATSDASLAQHTALEKHLAVLCARAEKLLTDFNGAIRRGTGSIDRLEERVEKVVDGAEECIGRVDERTAGVAGFATDIEAKMARMEAACARAETMESRLASFAEQLADQAGEVQGRINLLMSAVHTGEQMQTGLQAEFAAWNTHREEIEQLHDTFQTAARDSITAAREELDRQRERVVIEVTSATDEARAARRDLEKTVAESRRVEDRLAESVPAALEEKARAQLAECRAAMEAVVTESRAALTKELATRCARQTEALADAEQRAAMLRAAVMKSSGDLEAAEARSERLDGQVALVDSAVSQAATRANEIRDQLTTSVERADDLLSRTQASRGQIEGFQHTLSGMLIDAGQACERVRHAVDAVDKCERAAAGLARDHAAAEHVQQTLQSVVADGGRLHGELRETLAQAAQRTDELAARATAANEVAERLSDAAARNQELSRTSTRAADALAHAVRTANERCDRLAVVTDRGTELHGQLTDVVAAGGQLHQATQEIISYVDERLSRLSDARQTSDDLLQRLVEAGATTDRTCRAADDAARRSEAAADTVQALLGQAAEQAEAAQSRADQLEQHTARAGRVLSELGELTVSATEVAATLPDQTMRASQASERLAAECRNGGEVAARLATLEQLLHTSETAEADVRELLERATAARQGLATAASDASQHSELLERLADTARALIDIQERMGTDAEAASTRLAEQLAHAHGVVSAAETALDGFVAKAEALEARYDCLSQRADAVEGFVKEAMTRPAALVREARAQTDELQRIGTAVRKVFANLSRATLDAHNQNKELRALGNRTSRQLSKLTEHTSRAAGTLQQWVQEAVHAQSRLVSALRSCPTIEETHPPDDLHELEGEIRQPPATHGLAPAGRSGVLDPRSENTTHPRIPGPSPRTRSDQIAELLEQARKAEPTA